jgi:AAA+ superfamily predicted ATPase
MATDHLFDDVLELPDPTAARRFAALVGLDAAKERLIKEARLLLHPNLLKEWSKRHHKTELPILAHFQGRPPLFVFAGDVGTGKTTLAETFGDAVARQEKISATVYRLSLNARGSGAVGEMTHLISAAFKEVRGAAAKIAVVKGKPASALVLLVDEADALAQSRELAQMHHEDRAGVNALIRGIDELATEELPVLVVMCTNRLGALDPAVKRRAAQIFEFSRPNDEQRTAVLSEGLKGTNLTDDKIAELVRLTGRNGALSYGFTYSDLVQRLLPAMVLDAFPDQPIGFDRARTLTAEMKPTPPFDSELSNTTE